MAKVSSRRVLVYAVMAVVVLLEVAAAVYLYQALEAARQAARGQNVGAAADYPPRPAPYAVGPAEAPTFFIVNTGGALVAFVPYETNDNNFQDCRVQWQPQRARFRDGCLGASYALDGRRCDGPARRNLDQYALAVVAEQVWVNLAVVIKGAPAELVPDGALHGNCPAIPASQTN